MRKCILLAFVVVLLPSFLWADNFTVKPFVTNVTTTSIDICLQAELDLPATINYGLTAEYGHEVAVSGVLFDALWGTLYPPFGDPTYEAVERYAYCGRIEGLLPDTLYHYSVELGAEQTPDHEFATAPPAGTPFAFVVYGDSRSDPLYPLGVPNRFHEAVIERMKQYPFDFFINVGDIVHDGYDTLLWDIIFETISPISSEFAFYPVFGNHERRNELEVRGENLYSALFSNPGEASGSGNELYYSFDYCNAHYTVLDTNTDIDPDSVQGQWMRADLEAANNNPDIRWKFMFMHHPPYSSSLVGIGDERQRVARQYIPTIAEEFGVAIVFAGHQHAYERSFKDGVYYITTGNGGALPSFVQAPVLNQYTQFFDGNFNFSHFGFCQLDIADDYLAFQSVIASGIVIDEFEIGDAPPDDDDADDDLDDDAANDDVDDDASDDDAGTDDDSDQNQASDDDDDDDEGGCGC